MSRCFPFPPPGYERKARDKDDDFLIKEKHKGKKHKKEKEKWEGKSKKDKDKKRDKHKDKKGHKEKHKDKKDKDRSRTLNERKIEADTVGLNGTKISGNSQQAEIYPKAVELGKIIDDEEKRKENPLARTLSSSYGSIDGLGKPLQGVVNNIGCAGKTSNGRNFNVAENLTGKIKESIGKNKTIQGLKSINQRSEGISLLQNKEKGVERREDRNADLDKRSKKKSKDDINHEKKNGMEQKNNYKHRDNDLLQQSQANVLNIKRSHAAQVGGGNVDAKEMSLKRNNSPINGFLCEHDTSPNKLMRVTPHLSIDIDGRASEKKFLSPFQYSDNKLKPVLERKNNMENNINGKVISEESIFIQGKEICETSMKPPHPDAKYLSKVLSTSKMKEWPEFDDQEWFIQRNKKQSNHINDSTEIPQVWAECVRIESADIYALPYVIPY